jgi:nucleoside-diphosphate-sugar epimerase
MAKKYLVTGGTGFIGGALVKSLIGSGAVVRTFDNDSRGNPRKLGDYANDVERVTGDIRDGEAVRKAIRGVDCVCHLAYVNGTEYFYSKPDLILDVAVKGMTHVIDGCLAEGVGDLVLASSSEVYQTPPMIPTDENVPLVVPDVLNPRYSYGGGKIISELMAINYGRHRFSRVVIFRPHNVFGPDMGWQHVIPQLAVRMKRVLDDHPDGRPSFPIQGNGEETRAYIYIDDAAEGIRTIVEKGQHLQIYNVGRNEETSVAELVRQISVHFGREVTLQPGQLQPGGTLRRCPDIDKLRSLGFSPRFSLAQGLAETIPWYVTNPQPS